MDNKLYSKSYGFAWGGHKPDFSRCCATIYGNMMRGDHPHQCHRKRGHGPDQAYCKTHDPDAVAKREAANRKKYYKKMNEERYNWHGRSFFAALKKIADGHNDARGLAQDVIAEFEKGAYK